MRQRNHIVHIRIPRQHLRLDPLHRIVHRRRNALHRGRDAQNVLRPHRAVVVHKPLEGVPLQRWQSPLAPPSPAADRPATEPPASASGPHAPSSLAESPAPHIRSPSHSAQSARPPQCPPAQPCAPPARPPPASARSSNRVPARSPPSFTMIATVSRASTCTYNGRNFTSVAMSDPHACSNFPSTNRQTPAGSHPVTPPAATPPGNPGSTPAAAIAQSPSRPPMSPRLSEVAG